MRISISLTRITDFVLDNPKVNMATLSFVLLLGVITKTFSGYCCIQWMVCSDTYSFNFNTAGSATFATGTTGTACGGDYLMIPRKIANKLKKIKMVDMKHYSIVAESSCTGGGSLVSTYCGGYLVCSGGAAINSKILGMLKEMLRNPVSGRPVPLGSHCSQILCYTLVK